MTQLVSLSPRRNPIANRTNNPGTVQAVVTSTWTPANTPLNFGTWGGPGSVPSVGVSAGNFSVFMRPGVYHIGSNMIYSSNTTGRRIGGIELKATLDGTVPTPINDRSEHSFASTGTATWSAHTKTFFEYTAITYARALAWQSSGANLNIPMPGPSVMVERFDCWNYVP